jgi:glyoxylase-like metal-dependent hydrolase (beta-lactamase superfamily II)
MRVTGKQQREAWKLGVMPPVEMVRSGIWSVPVPIPQNPLRYTLAYLIAAGDDLVVVDPGWESEAGWSTLVDGLAVAGARESDVRGVVVTHVHADHHGLSARLRAASGAWIAMHSAEVSSMPSRLFTSQQDYSADADWLRSCGAPEEVVAALAYDADMMEPFLAMAEPDVLLEDGDLVPLTHRQLRVVWTPGHTPGHLCLHDEVEDVLLTGDHVLPRISPNIGLLPQVADLPLGDYLASLQKVSHYDSAEALPAHEYRFFGIADRVRVLQTHHEDRCGEILGVLGRNGDSTAWEVAKSLTWAREWSGVTGLMRRAAVAETAAHLYYLRELGSVISAEVGAGGPVMYSASDKDDVPAQG